MKQNDAVYSYSDHRRRLLVKSALIILSLTLSLSLFLFAAISTGSISRPDPTRLFPLSFSSSSSSPCSDEFNISDPTPTQTNHILFALSGSPKTWENRRHYSSLWWDPSSTRGFVWLDEKPDIWPDTSPPYKVSEHQNMTSSNRMARILKESFESGVAGVRWFVMGDDDTVFFPENLAAVLSRYDHRQMYYIGGSSESVEQAEKHGYGMAFGGGGFAVSYPMACEMVKVLDGCIQRYRSFYGSDEKVAACATELGVPLTRESGFHQLDVREDPYGLLAAHPVAPLVSLHHLDYVKPLFPNETQIESLKRLIGAYRIDPSRILQQSICYDHWRKWSVSISWGYTAQLYPSLIPPRVLGTPLQTFRTWQTFHNGPFVFNTRPLSPDPCKQPIFYFLDQVDKAGDGNTITTYKMAVNKNKCNQSAYKSAMLVEKIMVSSLKTDPRDMLKARRRQCCEISSGWTVSSKMRVNMRSCKPGETITV